MIDRESIAEVVAFARAMAPREVCGVIAAAPLGYPQRVIRCTNVSPTPDIEWVISAEEELRVIRETQQRDELIAAVFHSHPRSPAQPSQKDLDRALLPVRYLIVSLLREKPEFCWYGPKLT